MIMADVTAVQEKHYFTEIGFHTLNGMCTHIHMHTHIHKHTHAPYLSE